MRMMKRMRMEPRSDEPAVQHVGGERGGGGGGEEDRDDFTRKDDSDDLCGKPVKRKQTDIRTFAKVVSKVVMNPPPNDDDDVTRKELVDHDDEGEKSVGREVMSCVTDDCERRNLSGQMGSVIIADAPSQTSSKSKLDKFTHIRPPTRTRVKKFARRRNLQTHNSGGQSGDIRKFLQPKQGFQNRVKFEELHKLPGG